MENEKYFRITMESKDIDQSSDFNSDIKIIWETKFDDEIYDIIDGCIACLRGIGFPENVIIRGMEQSVNNHKESTKTYAKQFEQ